MQKYSTMKKVIFLAHFLLAIAGTMCGQTIISGEYFFDKDPGQGKGAGFPVQSADSIENQINIPTTGLSEGIHHLGIRFQNVSGVWSQTQARMFLSRKFAPAQTEIVAAEYFFDKDPGIGKGTALTLPVHGDSLYIKTILTNPFDTGAHTLYIRTRNASGEWSLFEGYPFNICSGYGAESEFFYHVEGQEVLFENQSIDAFSHKWYFGDGAEDSIRVNTAHNYLSGIYNSCLISHNPCGSDSTCRIIEIAGIQSAFPNHLANNGYAFTNISGINFDPGCAFYIRSQISSYLPDSIIILSSNEARLTWKFANASLGIYDLIVQYPNQIYDTLYNAFTIEKENNPAIKIELIGPERVRVNQPVRYQILCLNTGNTPAYGIPIYVKIIPTNIQDIEALVLEEFDNSTVPKIIFDSLPNNHFFEFYDSTLQKEGLSAFIVIPLIRPEETITLNLIIKTKTIDNQYDIKVHAWHSIINDPDLNIINNTSEASKGTDLCGNKCFQCLLDLLAFLPPPYNCFLSAAPQLVCTFAQCLEKRDCGKIDLLQNIFGWAADCIVGWGGFTGEVAKMIGKIDDVMDKSNAFKDCKECLTDSIYKKITPVLSIDPNEKSGKSGYSKQRFISSTDTYFYKVSFENSKLALAAAGQVIIRDYIDTAHLDILSVKYISFGFNDTIFYYDRHQNDSSIIDINLRPNKNIVLRHKAFTNAEKKLLEWSFVSLDTVFFDLTDNIDDGFLPPNITPPEGEGFVLFSIKPKSDLPHGTVIKNKADIIFDFNDPITTPEWINTIDKVKPESYIEILPDTLYSDTITLRMHGSDDGSGVQSYDIFLSVNDSAYTPYYQGLTGDSLRFAGNYNNTYRFFSRARDFVGNLEDTTHTADAQTRLLVSAGWINNSDSRVHFSPNPVRYTLYADINLPGGNVCMARLYNIFGHEVLRRDLPNRAISALDVSGLPEGLYFIEISRQGELRGLSKVIVIIK